VDSGFIYHWLYFASLAFDTWISKFFQNVGRFEQKIPGDSQRNRLDIFDYCLFVVRHDADQYVFGMGGVVIKNFGGVQF